jgi:hypothetical protein
VVVFGVGACAHKPPACPNLDSSEVAPAMGAGVAIQPVFAASAVKGWRIYNVRYSDQLRAQGIGDGSMVTHVCGIPVREIHALGGAICCSADVSKEFEVTFDIAGQEKSFMIRRP